MKQKLETNREFVGADNKEKMGEQFPNTFGGNVFFYFFPNLESLVFPILEKSLFPTFGNSSFQNVGKNTHVCQILEKLKGVSDPENQQNLG